MHPKDWRSVGINRAFGISICVQACSIGGVYGVHGRVISGIPLALFQAALFFLGVNMDKNSTSCHITTIRGFSKIHR